MKFPTKKKFGVIAIDPPWAYKTYQGNKVPARGKQPYATMTLDELKTLPIRKVAADNCVMMMWVISSHIDQAIELARHYGFTLKSLGFVWEKTCKGDPEKLKIGMGKWLRQEAEIALLFTKGKPSRTDAGVRQVIREPAREHSRKPDESYIRLERLAAGPYLDLFGRCTRKGWTVWGDEADKFDGVSKSDYAGPKPITRTVRRSAADILG